MATEFAMPTLRQLWQRWRHPLASTPPRRRNLPSVPSNHASVSGASDVAGRSGTFSSESPSWARVQQTVRQWPSGMPITSDLIARVFGVGRGQAWRWLERLERAGLVYATEDPPNAQGIRRKRRWVR